MLNDALFNVNDICMYIIEHNDDLEEDVTGDTGGNFRRMLVVLLQVRSPLTIFIKKNTNTRFK